MKKTIYALLITCLAIGSKAQTISTFDDITLSANSYNNGSAGAGGFNSGHAHLNNSYDTAFGGSWAGWTISNMKDSITKGYGNQYSAITGSGYNSANYAVAYVDPFHQAPTITLTGAAMGKAVKGFYITNSTYAYHDMKNGSGFSKKFGGVTGTDSDWFKLSIWGYSNGQKKNAIDFYLADYRNADSTKDYIVKVWQWVDLTSFGNADSLQFKLSSSDTGSFGMNTPAFFCMDNFTASDFGTGFSSVEQRPGSYIYPNPASSFINISQVKPGSFIQVIDMNGKTVLNSAVSNASQSIDIQNLENGLYIIRFSGADESNTFKFVKQ